MTELDAQNAEARRMTSDARDDAAATGNQESVDALGSLTEVTSTRPRSDDVRDIVMPNESAIAAEEEPLLPAMGVDIV